MTLTPPPVTGRRHLPLVPLWAVRVIEDDPPADSEPLDWLLLTTVPITCFADAQERVDWSVCRWTIEVWHKVLKSGCAIEQRQLASAENPRRGLALSSVIAAARALCHVAGPCCARPRLLHLAGGRRMASALLCHPCNDDAPRPASPSG